MRNGSIHNTSWESQSRGTQGWSFNSNDFSFSHSNTESEYCFSWPWPESNTVMSSQLRLSYVRVCSRGLNSTSMEKSSSPSCLSCSRMQWVFHLRWSSSAQPFPVSESQPYLVARHWAEESMMCCGQVQALATQIFQFLPQGVSLWNWLRLWNTCLVEDGGRRSSRIRKEAGVTPCGFRSWQAPSWTPAFCILAIFSHYFLPLTFVYWRYSVALVLRII